MRIEVDGTKVYDINELPPNWNIPREELLRLGIEPRTVGPEKIGLGKALVMALKRVLRRE